MGGFSMRLLYFANKVMYLPRNINRGRVVRERDGFF
jgi:hypothetical protein